MTSPASGRGEAEAFFRESDYWRAWSTVPDATADVAYALRALRPAHRSVLDVPCGRGRLLKAIARHRPDLRIVGSTCSCTALVRCDGWDRNAILLSVRTSLEQLHASADIRGIDSNSRDVTAGVSQWDEADLNRRVHG